MAYSELTDLMIRQSFEKTGVDQSYFSIYEAEAKRQFSALEKDCPNEDDNVESSLALTNDYLKYYVEESEKGHCNKWADIFARYRVKHCPEETCVRLTLNTIDSEEEKEKEFDFHINSMSDDPIFRKRYKFLFNECDHNPRKLAELYCETYHRCIAEGKSILYAHAYADEIDYYKPNFCKIYAEAYETAIINGYDDFDAHNFGVVCVDAADDSFWVSISDYLRMYHEDWQKEFYFTLMKQEFEESEHRKMSQLEEQEYRKSLF